MVHINHIKTCIVVFALSLFVVGCNGATEEIDLKANMKYQLGEVCKEDEKCIEILNSCLDKMDWEIVNQINNDDKKEEVEKEFKGVLFPCLAEPKDSPFAALNN